MSVFHQHIPEIVGGIEQQRLGLQGFVTCADAGGNPFHLTVVGDGYALPRGSGNLGDGVYGAVVLDTGAGDTARGQRQGLEGVGIILVSAVVFQEIPTGIGHDVGHFGLSGFPSYLRTHRQAAGLGAAVQRIGHVPGVGGFVSLFLGNHLLPLGVHAFFFGHFGGGIGLLLGFMGGAAFHLGPDGVAGGQGRLLFGPVALLVRDGFLLIGDILHLLAHSLDDGGILFGLGEAVHFLLHGGQLLPGMPAAQAVGDQRHAGQDHHGGRYI